MRRHLALTLSVLPALLALAIAPAGGTAQAEVRDALIRDLDGLEQRYTALAEAVPADDYDWRPADGVRSFSEAITHVVASNYYYTGLFADGRPDDVGIADAPDDLEEVTDKEQVLALLRAHFDHVRRAVEGTSARALARPATLYGQESSVAGVLLQLNGHMHEHLGQLIAYARSVGVAPPWSG